MEQQYLTCKCGVASCALSWKINSCIYSDNWNLFQHGDLHNIEYDTACSTRVLGQKPKKRYGIALCVQKIFYSWLKRNKRMTAFDLRAKLIEKRYKNNQKPNEQQSEKFKFNEQLIPKLVQTQTFVRRYRVESGINSPENIEELIQKHAYREDIGDDEPFVFYFENDKLLFNFRQI
jgi:hypothetical protein